MKIVTLKQGTPEWHSWRQDGIGGSDIAAILGISPYPDATRESVLAQKVNGAEPLANRAMWRGTKLEPVARSLFEVTIGRRLHPECVEGPLPFMRVSLDGLTEARDAACEIKCPNWKAHELAVNGVVADYFEVQCQWQMATTGLRELYFVSYNPGKRFPEENHLAVVKLTANLEAQRELIRVASSFWDDVCRMRKPSPSDHRAMYLQDQQRHIAELKRMGAM